MSESLNIKNNVKKLFWVILFVGVFSSLVQAEKNINPLAVSNAVVWAGLDYSMLHINGNTNDIKVPDLIYQDMPRKWNDLFLDERIEGVADSLDKQISIDINGVVERNASQKTHFVIFESDSTDALEKSFISQQAITEAIATYRLDHTNGIGLVFIIDSMIYHRTMVQNIRTSQSQPSRLVIYAAGINVVFFDIATRKIISIKREVNTTGNGGSFRNFWFGPIKDADSRLSKYR